MSADEPVDAIEESNVVDEHTRLGSAVGDRTGAGVEMIRLLVAEDHAAMREKVVGTLQMEYSVIEAVSDGQAVLDADSRFEPDVIVLDISMPTMNGIEAASRLRQRASKAKVIFLTVHEEPEFVQAALGTGALGYVIKSRLGSDLRPAVREAMAGRRFVSPPLSLIPDED